MAALRGLLVNPTDRRLRAGWRLLVSGVLFLLVSRAVTVLSFGLLGRPSRMLLEWWVLRGVIVALSATIAVWLARRFLDRRTFGSLGLRLDGVALRDGLAGFAISAAMLGLFIGVCLAFGVVRIQWTGWTGGVGPALAGLPLWLFGVGLAVAWSEELALRGYVLQNLGDGIGLTAAVLLSCVLYGAVHMANPHSTMLSGVLIAALGYLRVLGWLRTEQLWLAMGMHAGWNFLQGPVLGLSVSGTHTAGLTRVTTSGPGWFSGGAFGPEAGLAVVPALGLGVLLMHLWTRRRRDTPWTRAALEQRPLSRRSTVFDPGKDRAGRLPAPCRHHERDASPGHSGPAAGAGRLGG